MSGLGDDRKKQAAKAPPLRRGKACLNCRHLKIKCDGVHPICGQCIRVPKDDPCEFNDTSSRTAELERASTVSRLQNRINELEGHPGPSGRAVPYPGWSTTDFGRRNSPFSNSESSAGSRASPRASSDDSLLNFQEPPLVMIQMLLDHFLPHATQFGFFLQVERFREAALLSLEWANPLRPSPALLSVVYLWGVHLSLSQPLLSSEPVFLKRAQQQVASVDVAENNNSMHLLHTIQAQVLLSTYMFRNKRFLEAEFHANGAATLALGYQLHKIRSSRPLAPAVLGVPLLTEVYPTQPASPVEEGERIRAFWVVVSLQSSLGIALNAASLNFSILETSGASIDTPWPLEIDDYAAGALPRGYTGQETIKAFLTEDPSHASVALPTFFAKAAVLLHRASRLGANWSPNLSPQEASSYSASYLWLDSRITQFWETLPPLFAFYAHSSNARTLVLAHALTAAAAIRLHRSPGTIDPDAARQKCVAAARAILACIGDTTVPDFTVANPIVGSLCAMACRVLMEEVRKARAFRGAWGETVMRGEMPPPGAEEVALGNDLHAGMETMGVYAVGCSLIKYQLMKLQQEYEAPY
ncbi:Zn(2)-C6 fungal-type domain-containing protein [Favolaschia claudopus]|uniref:Zn(2)-C6 fungal-type domain-containing protein n=1 Tax=Favolaschia claudopus TaxID=2862362 RepID=A0AAW0CUI3_9AGAR